MSSLLLIGTIFSMVDICRKKDFTPAFVSMLGLNEQCHLSATGAMRGDSSEYVIVLTKTSFSLDLVIFILMTKRLIKWNNIHGVGALGRTGQLIPFVVSGSGLIKVLYKATYKAMCRDYRETFPLELSRLAF